MAKQQLTALISSGDVPNPWNEKITLPPQEPYGASALRFGITLLQYRWCLEMLSNGLNANQAAKTIGIEPNKSKKFAERALKNENVQKYLGGMHKNMEEKVELTLEYKYRKLKHIIDVCLPDGTEFYDKNTVAPQIALAAIAELNKMHGHYAATKTEVISGISPEELEHIKQLMERFSIEHKKDY